MSARVCLCHRPTTFSIDIETCYLVDTVPNSPIDEYKQGMKELATKFDAQTNRTVAKLHNQFGHPSAKALAQELHMRKCPKPWVACAKICTCEWCPTQLKPGLVRVASLRGTGLLFENIWSEKQCTVGVKKERARTTLVWMFTIGMVQEWCATEHPANLDLSLLDWCY